MAKTLKEAPITTANARSKLLTGVHWRGLDPEIHLGYRKGKRGGVWLVRWRVGKGYRQDGIGTADDFTDQGTLSFEAARRKARETVEKERAEARAAAAGVPLTVRSAVETYIARRDARDSQRKGRQVRSDAAQRLSRAVLGQPARGSQKAIPAAPLADVKLHALTDDDLLMWRNGLPDATKVSSKQRLVNDLKAALNDAYAANRSRLPATLPATIKHGLKSIPQDDDEAVPIARDNQILTDAQVTSLIRAAGEVDAEQEWDGDLYRLVVVLAATGARFSQVARMRVGDCQVAAGRLLVPVSRKGRGGKSGSTPISVGTDVLGALRPVVIGRAGDAFLLERWRHKQVKGSIRWERADRGPWQSPSELVRAWQEIRERVALREVIPYALRHSSIVRGIRANLPIRLVAAMHDTSVAMIERHYSKWIVSGLEELAAKAIVPLVPRETGERVVSIVRR